MEEKIMAILNEICGADGELERTWTCSRGY